MRAGVLSGEDWKAVAGWLLDEDLDAGVTRVLGLLGNRHGADRAWVVRYDAAFTFLWNTHEWVAPGILPQLAEVQGIPVEAILWIHEGLHREGRVIVPDVNAMPRRARGLQAELQRQGIRSLLSLPVFRDGKLAFQIGYDAVRETRVWPEAQVLEYEDAANLIARALWHRGSGNGTSFPSADRENRTIHLRSGGGSVAVPVSKIIWIEASGDYTIVHSKGRQRYTERRTVRDWEGLLPREEFLRIHRGAIVRAAAIQRLDRSGGKWRLTLAPDGPELPVGRAYHASVRLRLGF
ncbi:LytTR family transcriptional regulator DNA-binding domain-containing protein [Luteolibacter arcticus]|uniref:LytTR family transcriptional regulator DNA-binding domain-containing protein n=1 Tax=Luteolibacter arcticus TaxID=1581411 RepID=A0ABT3GFI8_9BACT|nr:LytTR family transcriptional regulator DNA-binding domain-containing protein [Luteolibacter arcticus]MCW1922038.1 LytTR family transcriptional regulator DNA-binding domain-containing protein [Luteolibacter arcticus]